MGSTRHLRLVTAGADDNGLRWGRVIALRAGVELVASIDARDGRGLAERASFLRARSPDVVLVVDTERPASLLAEVVEAARLAFSGELAVVHATDPAGDEAAAPIARLRGLRRADAALAIEAMEARARDLDADGALVCDVDGSGTRLALRSKDSVLGLELPGVGIGRSSDALARRVGARALRRWLVAEPLPDAASLRDRIANLALFGVDDDAAVAPLRGALLRESLGALATAARADVRSEVLSRPRRIELHGALVTLGVAEAAAVVLDASGAEGAARLTAGGRSLALLVVEPLRGGALELRIADDTGERRERIASGSLRLLATSGRVTVRGHGILAESDPSQLGVVVDTRTRPLALPESDGERLPLLRRWAAALGRPS